MKRDKIKKKNEDTEFIYLVCDDTEVLCEPTEEERLSAEYIQAKKELKEFYKTCCVL